LKSLNLLGKQMDVFSSGQADDLEFFREFLDDIQATAPD
jgi:hypothetical protein